MATVAGQRATPRPAAREWRCWYCWRLLGCLANGVLHEVDGTTSTPPIVRRCPDCHRRNVRLTG